MDESTPEKKNLASEDEKTEKDDSVSDKKISRQPTFSSFTPQPKDEKDYDNNGKDDISSERNLSYNERRLRPLLSSISGNQNLEEYSNIVYPSGKQIKQESCFKSSEGTYPQFFVSSDTKNFAISSEGSRKYRSPTFEAISEEENNMSQCMVDSPTHKRLSMDIDCPEKFLVQRATKRPPSIHAALSPDLSLIDKEIIGQHPKLIVAHYEGIIHMIKGELDTVYGKNSELEQQVKKLKAQISDSNKILLKVQEEKEADKMKFLEMLNKLNNQKEKNSKEQVNQRKSNEETTLKK